MVKIKGKTVEPRNIATVSGKYLVSLLPFHTNNELGSVK